jgi:hypothetical protein
MSASSSLSRARCLLLLPRSRISVAAIHPSVGSCCQQTIGKDPGHIEELSNRPARFRTRGRLRLQPRASSAYFNEAFKKRPIVRSFGESLSEPQPADGPYKRLCRRKFTDEESSKKSSRPALYAQWHAAPNKLRENLCHLSSIPSPLYHA